MSLQTLKLSFLKFKNKIRKSIKKKKKTKEKPQKFRMVKNYWKINLIKNLLEEMEQIVNFV